MSNDIIEGSWHLYIKLKVLTVQDLQVIYDVTLVVVSQEVHHGQACIVVHILCYNLTNSGFGRLATQ